MNTMGLNQWQQLFKRYLFTGANEAQLAQAIADPTGIGAVTRMDVYRNAYYIRLQEALAHDFPVLLAVLGDEAFGHQMAHYLQACPSNSPSLRYLGQSLSDWLRKGDEPVLADLAALEWAVLTVFDAADASPLDADDLVTVLPEHWHQLRFELHPALSLLQTQSNAHELWAAHRNQQVIPPIQSATPYSLAIWRGQNGPTLHIMSEQAFGSLNGLGDDCTFGDICVRLAQQGPAEEVPAIAAQLLMEFFSNGWITAIKGTLSSRGSVNLTPWSEIQVTHRSTD